MKVWDLHCDTLSELRHARQAGRPLSFARNGLHIDLAKLEAGGLYAAMLCGFCEPGGRG